MRTLRDGLLGLATGDALGVPVETRERDTYRVRGMEEGGVHHMPRGTFSDDTSLALATCAAIRAKGGRIDCALMRRYFKEWLLHGAFTADGKAFSVGATCLKAILSGKGQTGEMSNGNGSLMRILPLAFTKASDREIREVSAITHGAALSMDACVFYVHAARLLLEGRDFAASVREASRGTRFSAMPEKLEAPRDEIRSTGYVLDTLEAALWANGQGSSYREVVLAAVNLGGDTDTVGSVAGGLAGIRFGWRSIPADWLSALRGKEWIEKCLF